jgi:hypothetical protein
MTYTNRAIRNPLAIAVLAAALTLGTAGCGGGDTAPAGKTTADTLGYTPATGTYSLVRNASRSTPGHLVLDLVGPAGNISGVGLYLTADQAKVTWATVGAGDPEKVSSVTFTSTLVKSKVTGDTLQAGVYQKGTIPSVPVTPTTVLASVALDLKPGIPVNTAVAIAAVSGKALVLNDPAGSPATTPITIAVGTLVAN